MSEIRDKIRSRGHWQVSIRPEEFRVRLDDLGELDRLVRSLAVQLRGWDFPHIDTNMPILRGLDWVGQESQWAHHLEAWRLHSNGLFLSTTGLPVDWRDESTWWPADDDWQPGELLGVGDALFSMTEFLELASRLSTAAVGGEEMRISIELHNVESRLLYVDAAPRRFPFDIEYRSGVDTIPVEETIERTRLVGEAWEIAAVLSQRIFQVFGWDIDDVEVLLDQQKELRKPSS